MLTIRRQQIAAFAEAIESEFLENIVQRVVRSDLIHDDSIKVELRKLAKQALLQARTFSFLAPDSLSTFIECCLVRRELFRSQLRVVLLAEDIEGSPLNDQARLELLLTLQEADPGETIAMSALRARSRRGPKMAARGAESDT